LNIIWRFVRQFFAVEVLDDCINLKKSESQYRSGTVNIDTHVFKPLNFALQLIPLSLKASSFFHKLFCSFAHFVERSF